MIIHCTLDFITFDFSHVDLPYYVSYELIPGKNPYSPSSYQKVYDKNFKFSKNLFIEHKISFNQETKIIRTKFRFPKDEESYLIKTSNLYRFWAQILNIEYQNLTFKDLRKLMNVKNKKIQVKLKNIEDFDYKSQKFINNGKNVFSYEQGLVEFVLNSN